MFALFCAYVFTYSFCRVALCLFGNPLHQCVFTYVHIRSPAPVLTYTKAHRHEDTRIGRRTENDTVARKHANAKYPNVGRCARAIGATKLHSRRGQITKQGHTLLPQHARRCRQRIHVARGFGSCACSVHSRFVELTNTYPTFACAADPFYVRQRQRAKGVMVSTATIP